MISREIESLRRGGSVQNGQDSFNDFQQIGTNTAAVATLVESLQATMLEASDHSG
jgi:hypothetical protein